MKVSNEKKGVFVAQGLDPDGNSLKIEGRTRVEVREIWLSVFALRYARKDGQDDDLRAA